MKRLWFCLVVAVVLVGCGSDRSEDAEFWKEVDGMLWEEKGLTAEECEVAIVEREEYPYREAHRQWGALVEMVCWGDLSLDSAWAERMDKGVCWIHQMEFATSVLNPKGVALYEMDLDELYGKYATLRGVAEDVFGGIVEGGYELIEEEYRERLVVGDTMAEVDRDNDLLWWNANKWRVRYDKICAMPKELAEGDTMTIGTAVNYVFTCKMDGVRDTGEVVIANVEC